MSNRILEALKSREWVDYLDIFSGRVCQMCPTCNQAKEKGHKQDCEYLARMKEAERLPKRLTVEDCKNLAMELQLLSEQISAKAPERFANRQEAEEWYEKTKGLEVESHAKAIHTAICGEEKDHE